MSKIKGFRKTALTKLGAFTPARKGMVATGGIIKPTNKKPVVRSK